MTVCAAVNPCYNFVNWTDQNSNVVSASTCYTFTVTTSATLVANFALARSLYTITTTNSPSAGGSTSGGGIVSLWIQRDGVRERQRLLQFRELDGPEQQRAQHLGLLHVHRQ